MRTTVSLSLALIFVAGLLFVDMQAASGAGESELRMQDETAQKLAELTKRVEKLESEKATMEVKMKAQSALLADIYGWLRTLPETCTALDQALSNAQKNGFEKAGPNPRAKKQVIRGLKSFAMSLNAGNPAKAKKKTK